MSSKGDQEIIKAIIAMAHNLNIDAVAEGVETQEQKDFLASYGCNSMQGFFFAHPVPVEKFKDLLKRQQRTAPPGKDGIAVKGQGTPSAQPKKKSRRTTP